jgi:hypothetical protein
MNTMSLLPIGLYKKELSPLVFFLGEPIGAKLLAKQPSRYAGFVRPLRAHRDFNRSHARIGSAIALALRAAGVEVHVQGRTMSGAASVARGLRATAHTALFRKTDM